MHYSHKDGISFKKITRDDLVDLLSLKMESWWGTHSTLFINLEDQNKWYDSIPSNQLFMIGFHASDKLGVLAITDIDFVNRKASISGSVKSDYRSKYSEKCFYAGLDFAFEMLNLNRVEAEVLEYHLPAIQLEVNKLGFKIEGRRKKAVYKCGKYYDSLVLGMLREEWENSDRVRSYHGSCNNSFDIEKIEKMLEKVKNHLGQQPIDGNKSFALKKSITSGVDQN